MVIFVIGGSGSGKSEFAENLAVELQRQDAGKLVYIATMEPLDEESKKRIRRHQDMRAGKGFETREHYTHLEGLEVRQDEVLLLECLSNLTANEMFSEKCQGRDAGEVIKAGLLHLAEQSRHLIVVGNNVFEDGLNYDGMTREYLRQMARLHQFLGKMADRVVEVVCGVPVEWRAYEIH